MKEFANYKEYLNSSENSTCYNNLYIGKDWHEVHRIQGGDVTRKKMIALIAELNLNDFLMSIDADREVKMLKLFENYGYVPVAVYDEEKCKDYLFARK